MTTNHTPGPKNAKTIREWQKAVFSSFGSECMTVKFDWTADNTHAAFYDDQCVGEYHLGGTWWHADENGGNFEGDCAALAKVLA